MRASRVCWRSERPIADRSAEGEVGEIKDIMTRCRDEGMQTFDPSLFDRDEASLISEDSAIRFADSQNEVRLLIKLERARKKSTVARVTDGVSQFAILETRPAPLMNAAPPRRSAGAPR